jgi:hypothetical protein
VLDFAGPPTPNLGPQPIMIDMGERRMQAT